MWMHAPQNAVGISDTYCNFFFADVNVTSFDKQSTCQEYDLTIESGGRGLFYIIILGFVAEVLIYSSQCKCKPTLGCSRQFLMKFFGHYHNQNHRNTLRVKDTCTSCVSRFIRTIERQAELHQDGNVEKQPLDV